MIRGEAKQASQGPQTTTNYRLAEYNVLAAFETLEDARAAMESLGRHGIEGQHITIQGDAPDEAATRSDTYAADRRMMAQWVATVIRWSAIGSLIGAVVGVPIGLVLLGDPSFMEVLGSAFFGALFGSIAFGLVGMVFNVYDTKAWELSFHETYRDSAVVGVHSNQPGQVETAAKVLREHGALAVHRPTAGDPQRAVQPLERG